MKTHLHQMKAYGYAPHVELEDLDSQADAQELAAFSGMFANRLCGHPDLADRELAEADPAKLAADWGMEEVDAECLCRCHQRFLEATGSGSYPHSCNSDYPGVHAINWYINVSSFNSVSKRTLTDSELQTIVDARVWGPSGDPQQRAFTIEEVRKAWSEKPMWQVMRDFTAETYRRLGVVLLPVEAHGQDNIHVLSRRIGGSTIGIGWFPNSQGCPGDHVEFHIDSTYTAGFQGQLSLWIHECGHTMKLPHQFGNQGSHQEPMSYNYRGHLVNGYSDGSDVFGLPRAPSTTLLTRYYGGKPVGIPWAGMFGGDPEPPPPEGEYNVAGVLVVAGTPHKLYTREGD